MGYDAVDPAIDDWVSRHGLHLYTSFGGDATRCAYVSSVAGDVFQIWVDEPRRDDVSIHAAGVEGAKEDDPPRDWLVPVDQLGPALDEVLRVVVQWMQPSVRYFHNATTR